MSATIIEGSDRTYCNQDKQQSLMAYDSVNGKIKRLVADEEGHLNTAMQQDVQVDPNNSSTTNLAAGNSYTFTGTATSTLGVIGLQWALKTTQNATVYIEESNDTTNWDISYSFNYIASNGGRGDTVQATMAYWRIRVVLVGTTATSYFRLSGVLCPIAVPLPSALSPDGRLLVETSITGQQNADRHVWVTSTNSLTVNNSIRLVGTNFDGIVLDAVFWTPAVSGTGTVTQNGEVKLTLGATANSTASYVSDRRARFVVGSALQFTGVFKFHTVGAANNVQRLGAYDATDGFFFQLAESTFSVGSRTTTAPTTTDTLVSSGNFNGRYGTTWIPVAGTYYRYDIEWTPIGAHYYVNGILLHKSVGGHLTRKLTQPIKFENVNSGGGTTNVIMDCLGAVIIRQGDLLTQPNSYYHAYGATAGVQLKVGAGNVHSIFFGGAANNATVTLSDSLTAATPALLVYLATGALGAPVSVDLKGMPFYNGLRLTVTSNANCTIVYE